MNNFLFCLSYYFDSFFLNLKEKLYLAQILEALYDVKIRETVLFQIIILIKFLVSLKMDT